MKVSLSNRIANHKDSASNKRNHKAIFLAQKNEIFDAISDGWSLKAIWQTLHHEEKFFCSYKTFCLYVSKYIKRPSATTKLIQQDATREDSKAQSKPPNTNVVRGFTFNPKPNLEELL